MKKRPGTAQPIQTLATLVILLMCGPLFFVLKGWAPYSPHPGKGLSQSAPAFTLQDQLRNVHTLGVHGGKGLFLYFFSPGYAKYTEDLEKISEAYRENIDRKENFEFIGICSGCNQDESDSIALDENIPFPFCPDPKRRVTKSFEITALPVAMVISGKGTIRYDHVGTIREMQDVFDEPFWKFLGIRLGIWRYRYGTAQEKKEFVNNLPPEQQLRRYDPTDEGIREIADLVPCICNPENSIAQCACNPHYAKAMFTWINFFLKDGSFSKQQIVQIMTWKYEGEKAKEDAKQVIPPDSEIHITDEEGTP